MIFENSQLNSFDLPAAEQLVYESLSTEYKAVHYLRFTLWCIALLIGGIVLFAFNGLLLTLSAWAILIGGIALYALLSIFLLYKGFPKKGYALRERDIAYQSGWIYFSQTLMPFGRIQHCEVSQGPLEKMFDLCSLNIYTAGGNGSDLQIPGLPYETGENMRDFLLKKITETNHVA